MRRKLLACALSAVLAFGTAAALPRDASFGTTITASAASVLDSGSCGDGVTYKLTSDGTLTISGSGEMKEYGIQDPPWNDNIGKIKKLVVQNGVTSISGRAFAHCTALTEAALANSVKTIYSSAFYGCMNLKTVTMPDSMERIEACAFCECSSLTAIKIPSGIETVDARTFRNCTALKSVTFPSSVTLIDEEAFLNCTSLSGLSLPNGLVSIWSNAFKGCTSLTSVSFPKSVAKIGPSAFQSCTALKTAAIANDNADIKAYAFYRCPSLTIKGRKGSTAENYVSVCTAPDTGYTHEGLKFALLSEFSDCKVTIPYSSYTYRGRGIKPTVTVKDASGSKLTKGTDYTVSYSNNTKVGTATITIKGKGSYFGELKKTFKVKPLDLSSSYAKVTIPYSSYTYTGSQIKPAVKVKFKDGDIIPTSDYTFSYSNNTKVGVATITVKAKGSNTTGTYKKEFVVKPEKNAIKSISSTKGAFKITWNKATAGATGYQVQYSTDKNFKKNVHSYTSTNLSDLSENFSSVPKSGETWYVKVRSFVTKDGKATSTRYGNYSDVKTIKVK